VCTHTHTHNVHIVQSSFDATRYKTKMTQAELSVNNTDIIQAHRRKHSVFSSPPQHSILNTGTHTKFVSIFLHHIQCVKKTKGIKFSLNTSIKGYLGEEV
jgi:hypothetical protein